MAKNKTSFKQRTAIQVNKKRWEMAERREDAKRAKLSHVRQAKLSKFINFHY